MIAVLLAFFAAAAAESVPVHDKAAAEAAIVGFLERGDVVEVQGCAPSCNDPNGWALLDGGAARLRNLRHVASNISGPSATRFIWGTLRGDAALRERPSAGAAVVGRQRSGAVLAFRSDPSLLARGWLERSSGGFVAARQVRLAHPSALRGEFDPSGPTAFVVRSGLGLHRYARFRVLSASARDVRSAAVSLPRSSVRIALPRPPPAGLEPGEKWVHVDLREQVLTAYEGERMVFATLVSTGKTGDETAPGSFRVWLKSIHHPMDGRDGERWHIDEVPFVLAYHRAQALHGAFWHDRFGDRLTHGCINLSLADAEWLFSWAPPPLPKGWHAVLPERGLRVIVERAPFALIPPSLASR